jgi:hypothetical protein
VEVANAGGRAAPTAVPWRARMHAAPRCRHGARAHRRDRPRRTSTQVTIAMLERNLLRLHANFHMPAPRYHALVRGALLAAALGGVAVALARAR